MKRLDIDIELVIDMYVNQGMPLTKIGEILDADPSTIKQRLKKRNVAINSRHSYHEKQVDIEKMVDMYVNQKMNSYEISEKLNICPKTICIKLKQLGVKLRSSGESMTKELDIVKLEDLYVNQKMSCPAIAKIIEASASTIYKNLKILGIPRRGKSEALRLIHTQKKKDCSRNNMSTRNIVGRGSSCIEHQHFSGGPNLGNQTPIRKRLGGNSPNPTTI